MPTIAITAGVQALGYIMQLFDQYNNGQLTAEQVAEAFQAMADGYNKAVAGWNSAPGPGA